MVQLTRRKALGAIASGVAVSVAGCGDEAGDGGDEPGGGDGETGTPTATATETATETETETEEEDEDGMDGGGLPEVLSMPGEKNPESFTMAADGTLYFGALTQTEGEVRRISAAQTQETGLELDDAEVVGELPGPVIGIQLVPDDAVYAATLAGEQSGVWRVPIDGGDPEPHAHMEGFQAGGFPNDITHDEERDRLLVTDSFAGEVRAVPLDADDPEDAFSVWLADDRLATEEFGANGLDVDGDGVVHVAVTQALVDGEDVGRVVSAPIAEDGSAGDAEVTIEGPEVLGADGLTVHEGDIHVAANQRNEIVRLAGMGDTEVLAAPEDGLVFPSDVEFGRSDEQEGQAFICNFANETPEEAGILRLEL